MDNNELFEFMTKMYSDMQEGFKKVNSRLDDHDSKFNSLEKNLVQEIQHIGNQVTKLEDNHVRKLEALFDGQKQLQDQLNRIEEEVKKHDEIILRRIK